VSRFLPAPIVLVTVTGLLLAYGSTRWSWIAGPIAALAIWALDLETAEPAEPAPAPVAADPEPVD
jgi:hypothetical protein